MKIISSTTLLATAMVATMATSSAFAETVRMGTEGAYAPYNSSMTTVKLMALSANLETSCAKSQSLNVPGLKTTGTPLFPTWYPATTMSLSQV